MPAESLLVKIQEALLNRKETVASAESCTGGLVATALTHLPGSSSVYLGGVSAYHNRVKADVLGVSTQAIDSHGAVSPEVAEAMARGIRDRAGSTYAVALTGVAGPGGGTPTKPVGTVYCGVASPRGVRHLKWNLKGDRVAVRESAAERALEELYAEITNGR